MCRIKKAYRRRALELHPDRNYGNVDEATRLFAEVQVAYEVLADPQERAWYDSHSDAFLGTNGSSGEGQHSYNIRLTTADDVFAIFSKFSPRMDFTDSPSGFFGGLREQFAQLALEERLACQWENQEMVDYPSFGTSDDDFESVVRPFYSAWTSFSTRKSFAWKDAYRYSEAPDRRVRRLMEKENRRLREEAVREFNDAVRSLVAFVKKRDPRFKANAKNEAQRQETLRQSVAAQAARSRAINQAKMREHIVPQWAQSEDPVADEEEESSASEVESFDCVACNKCFKSQKQFEAHERSKKHLKAVKQLRREMLIEHEELELDTPASDDISDQTVASSNPRGDTYQTSDGIEDSCDTRAQGPSEDHLAASAIQGNCPLESDESQHPSSDDDCNSLDDGDYASRASIETRLRGDFGPPSGEDTVTPPAEHLCLSDPDNQSTRLPGKAKQKRAKKQAARDPEQLTGLMCTNCRSVFSSRTKLFAHIRENPAHARPVGRSVKSKRR